MGQEAGRSGRRRRWSLNQRLLWIGAYGFVVVPFVFILEAVLHNRGSRLCAQ